ncbi:TerD family protein [Streptomyces virginiae]|uniref:TerD family protein n=1 Tax=Streptomyces virginiae TaxID=1961 RepID=UPI00363355E5
MYRRGTDWKVRAVGQGYASGLAGLATDYGVDIDPEPTRVPLPAQTRTTTPAFAAVDLTKLERQAPPCWHQRDRPVRPSPTGGSPDGTLLSTSSWTTTGTWKSSTSPSPNASWPSRPTSTTTAPCP